MPPCREVGGACWVGPPAAGRAGILGWGPCAASGVNRSCHPTLCTAAVPRHCAPWLRPRCEMPLSKSSASGRRAPAPTRGDMLVDVTIRWGRWARTFSFQHPVTPASILLEMPALKNCKGFMADGPIRGPGRLPMLLPMTSPVPRNTELWVQLAWPERTADRIQEVHIAGPDSYYPMLVDVCETPEEALWPIGYAFSGVGHRTTWWERWFDPILRRPCARRLHNHIPLGLQGVGRISALHWNFEVETLVQTRQHGDGWLPFDLNHVPRANWRIPAEVEALALANWPPEWRRSRTRSPRPTRHWLLSNGARSRREP